MPSANLLKVTTGSVGGRQTTANKHDVVLLAARRIAVRSRIFPMDTIGLTLVTFGIIAAVTPAVAWTSRKLHGPEERSSYIALINRIDRQIARVSMYVAPPLLLVGILITVAW